MRRQGSIRLETPEKDSPCPAPALQVGDGYRTIDGYLGQCRHGLNQAHSGHHHAHPPMCRQASIVRFVCHNLYFGYIPLAHAQRPPNCLQRPSDDTNIFNQVLPFLFCLTIHFEAIFSIPSLIPHLRQHNRLCSSLRFVYSRAPEQIASGTCHLLSKVSPLAPTKLYRVDGTYSGWFSSSHVLVVRYRHQECAYVKRPVSGSYPV